MSRQNTLGVLFVDMRTAKSQNFMNELEQIGLTAQFRIVDVSREPHKFTEPLRRHSRGQLPMAIIRGMNNYLVDQQAFHWLNIEKNKRARMPSMPVRGPMQGHQSQTRPVGGPGPSAAHSTLVPGGAAAHVQGAAAQNSLDAMYAPLINPNNVQLPQGSGSGGKISNGEYEAYMQSRNQGIPGSQRRL